MIVVAGRVKVKSGKRAEATAAALAMAGATNEEPGCVSYRFYADLEDPDTFFVFEEWKTADDLAKHFQTPHMAAFQQKLPAIVAGGSTVQRYEVSSVGPMM